MIRDKQIEGLTEASKHNLIAGFLINFRNSNNDTFFLKINDFNNMIKSIDKQSFNISDIKNNGGIAIECTKKRTRYTYNIEKFITEVN